MANGRIVTGFSKPYVAIYNNNAGVVSYTKGQILARGVEVSLEPESSDDNNFYADNVVAETAAGTFTGGSVTFTVDGLLSEAERLIFGLPEPDENGGITYDDRQSVPYCGAGWITRYQSGGVVTYVPTVVYKIAFSLASHSAATQEDEIDFQTQELEATLMRSDAANRPWRYIGGAQDTEEAAEKIVREQLGLTE